MRDPLLGLPEPADIDVVLEDDALELAAHLHRMGVAQSEPATYARFGTAMVRLAGTAVELATARAESYSKDSRKPVVRSASLQEDARRRDFTVNALLRNVHSNELADPLCQGLKDLEGRILRTPLEPRCTFYDDPLRMLRAVRFRWQLGLEPAAGLYEAIRKEVERLRVVSAERIRDELVRMLALERASGCLQDLADLGLLGSFAPELAAMQHVEQGSYHHLDVWRHTLKVVDNVDQGDRTLRLAALLHDVGKPATRSIDAAGSIRFYGHESVGEELSRQVLLRLRFSAEQIEAVARLVKNHMRLGSAPSFSPAAARRLLRDLGEDSERLFALVDADQRALKPGVRPYDLRAIRATVEHVARQTPPATLRSPLGGDEIMRTLGLEAGPGVGRAKAWLLEQVMEGALRPEDREGALKMLVEAWPSLRESQP